MEYLLFFTGRLHPLLVHLPIGILILVLALECYAGYFKKDHIKEAVGPSLFFGALAASVSVLSGLLLSDEGGYDNALMFKHRIFGILTALASWLAFVYFSSTWAKQSAKGRLYRIPILFIPVILIFFSGHTGGSLTHGEDFLIGAKPADEVGDEPGFDSIPNIREAYVYDDIIQPLLKKRCYACHSSVKQKGGLRLDSEDFILKGGKEGRVVLAGNPDSSQLYHRLLLPISEKHHMPPQEKSQLITAEIDLIYHWIKGGTLFDTRVNELPDSNKIIRCVDLILEHVKKEMQKIDEPKVAGDPAVIKKLKEKGIQVLVKGKNSKNLSISFINHKVITSDDLKELQKLSLQIVSIDASWSSLSDKDISSLLSFSRLREISLRNTQITDKGLANIGQLKELKSLNLVETTITDQSVKYLMDINHLEHLYLYGTKLSKKALEPLISKKVTLDTGHYRLPFLMTDTLVYKKPI